MVLKINSLPFYTLILIGSHGSAAVALTALGAVLGVCVCLSCTSTCAPSYIARACPCVPLCGHGRVNDASNSRQILLRTPGQGAGMPFSVRKSSSWQEDTIWCFQTLRWLFLRRDHSFIPQIFIEAMRVPVPWRNSPK